MSTDVATDGGNPFGFVKSTLFLWLVVLVIVLALVGFLAPYVPILFGGSPGQNEFVGIIVGMSWSLAALIVIVSFLAWTISTVRQALR